MGLDLTIFRPIFEQSTETYEKMIVFQDYLLYEMIKRSGLTSCIYQITFRNDNHMVSYSTDGRGDLLTYIRGADLAEIARDYIRMGPNMGLKSYANLLAAYGEAYSKHHFYLYWN